MLRTAIPHWRWQGASPSGPVPAGYGHEWPPALDVFLELTKGDSNVMCIGVTAAEDGHLELYVVVKEIWEEVQKAAAIAAAYDSDHRIAFRVVRWDSEEAASLTTGVNVWLERKLSW